MNTTIAAISTAYGEGGIGIVRISGERSREILDRLFYGKNSGVFPDRHMHYGTIREPESTETIDEVLAVFMEGPHSYTGEDVAEIHCHGSVVSLRKILKLACENGAELAERGEFTKRAFLNGRLDLTQAEAVIDVVKAKTEEGAKAAILQLEGALGRKISALRELLSDTLAEAIVNMDYPDEDEIPADDGSAVSSISAKLAGAEAELSELIATADTGRMLREGISVVIAGKANVGKSSLLNMMLKESRAIVTDTPGTTRDSIEEFIEVQGIPVKLTDTAGIRQTENEAERIGVERTGYAIDEADLIVLMLDGSAPVTEDDRKIFSVIEGRNSVIVLNKCDLPGQINESSLPPGRDVISLSALTGEGVKMLEEYLVSQVFSGNLSQRSSMIITNARHLEALLKAREEIRSAIAALRLQGTPDFAEMNTRTAWEKLGEITGETATDDILDKVFENFCVGK